MFKYPDIFITPTSAARNLMVKTFAVRRTDIYQGVANSTNTNTFGYNVQQGQGNSRGLKAIFPAQVTIAGIFFQNPQLANATGTGITGTLRVGRSVPVIGMSAPNSSSTVTVYCQYAHGLTTGDTVLVSDSIAFAQTGAVYATPATFNNCTPITVNGITTNTVGGSNQGAKVSYVVTPHATDPTIFTFTMTPTSSAAIQAGTIGTGFGASGNTNYGSVGLVVCDTFYGTANVNTGGLGLGFQLLPLLKNVGTFSSQNSTLGTVAGYWQVAPNQPIGVVTTPGTPLVWSVSGALNALLGSDGNYSYFVEPGQDMQMFAYYQSTVTSGSVTDPTLGGPWTVFVYFFA